MKRKVIISLLLVFDMLLMFYPWFKGIHGIHDIDGTIMFHNPIAFCCMILVFFGLWMNHEYGEVFTCFGWIGMIVMQIYEAMTWHIRMFGGTFDVGFSLELCYPIFFVALLWLCFSFGVYKYVSKKPHERGYSSNSIW